jgi:hypothetical protein
MGIQSVTKFLQTPHDLAKVKANDTLFVSVGKLDEFVQDGLPHIHEDVVILSTTFHFLYPPLEWMQPKAVQITSHPRILQWFVTNIQNYTGGMQDHPKVHSSPLLD